MSDLPQAIRLDDETAMSMGFPISTISLEEGFEIGDAAGNDVLFETLMFHQK